MKYEGGPEFEVKGDYIDFNIEIGLLKEYKEHVEEKIDFSDEDGAKNEHFYLELQRELEISLWECAGDLGRNILQCERTLEDYKRVAKNVHTEVKKEVIERRYGGYKKETVGGG